MEMLKLWMFQSTILEFSPQRPISLAIRPTVPREREICTYAIIMKKVIAMSEHQKLKNSSPKTELLHIFKNK